MKNIHFITLLFTCLLTLSTVESETQVDRVKRFNIHEVEGDSITPSFCDTTISLLKKFEGFKGTVYRCPAGKRTIGYGHALLPKEHFTKISEKEAEALLKRDLKERVLLVKRDSLNLKENQVYALAAFVFNVGYWNYKRSTLRKVLINDKSNFDRIQEEWLKWIHYRKNGQIIQSSNLRKRRKTEIRLWLN